MSRTISDISWGASATSTAAPEGVTDTMMTAILQQLDASKSAEQLRIAKLDKR